MSGNNHTPETKKDFNTALKDLIETLPNSSKNAELVEFLTQNAAIVHPALSLILSTGGSLMSIITRLAMFGIGTLVAVPYLLVIFLLVFLLSLFGQWVAANGTRNIDTPSLVSTYSQYLTSPSTTQGRNLNSDKLDAYGGPISAPPLNEVPAFWLGLLWFCRFPCVIIIAFIAGGPIFIFYTFFNTKHAAISYAGFAAGGFAIMMACVGGMMAFDIYLFMYIDALRESANQLSGSSASSLIHRADSIQPFVFVGSTLIVSCVCLLPIPLLAFLSITFGNRK